MDMGISCLISTSFAGIFKNNCFNNGQLPLLLPREQVELLLEDYKSRAVDNMFTVDLVNQKVIPPNGDDINELHLG
jgi:3-isopropylmalate dehydratase small subunit